MAKRLTLTRGGERAFLDITQGVARALEATMHEQAMERHVIAEKAGVHPSVVTRVLTGSKNVEIRTIAALIGAMGFTIEIQPKKQEARPRSSNVQGSRKRKWVVKEEAVANGD